MQKRCKGSQKQAVSQLVAVCFWRMYQSSSIEPTAEMVYWQAEKLTLAQCLRPPR